MKVNHPDSPAPRKRMSLLAFTGSLLFLTPALILSGCCHSDKLLTAAEAFHQSVGPQYLRYVEADEKLTDEAKKRKRLNVNLHGKALDQFKTGE